MFDTLLTQPTPLLALAPMQDVTDLPFWKLICLYGGPDVYYTEYFRVHSSSRLDRNILESITLNPTGRPAIAQMIGNDIEALVRTAKELIQHPVAAVDLNLGCPAPVVYRKCAGGGLLREPDRVDANLGALREAIPTRFTVKTRLGFDSPGLFDVFLKLFAKHSIDLVTVHGRTVYEGYRSEVHFDYIRRAVEHLPCPVLANGNVYSAHRALEILQETGARGCMIGRGAIRNPWIFQQFRDRLAGKSPFIPIGTDVLHYIRALYDTTRPANFHAPSQVEKMKKYLNYIGIGVEPTGAFLHDIRRVSTEQDFFKLCEDYLHHDRPMPLEPFPIPLGERDVLAGQHR